MPDLDWVTLRGGCVTKLILRDLRAGIEKDVKTRNAQLSNADQFRFEVRELNVELPGFRVVRLGEDSDAVDFSCDKAIIYVSNGKWQTVQATLTLNDEGECRLKIPGVELLQDLWQFRRRMLEELFRF